MKSAIHSNLLLICLLSWAASGCSDPTERPAPPVSADTDAGAVVAGSQDESGEKTSAEFVPQVIELDADSLLSMRLDEPRLKEGWVRLFDGYTLYGWQITGAANWRVEDQTLVVDSGEQSLLCTSMPWKDYEFSVEFRANADTNSGIFLRTPLVPQDPSTDCYELNIAPPDNPFPTASLVGRKKIETSTLADWDPEQWHRYLVRVDGDKVTVHLDGNELYTYTDPNPLPANRIALQHNQGPVEFRECLVRPLGLRSLLPESRTPGQEQIEGWKRYPEMAGSFDFDEEGNLHVRGGKTQLESENAYADFSLLVRAQTVGAHQNSGIFFRCIPGEEMNGYECQINNDAVNGNPLLPADCGTGGIFRRQDARIIAADNDEWFSMLLVADGPDMAAWVNGIQVSEWRDEREPDPNPRKGKRLEAGTLMLQGHDETTNVLFKSIEIAPRD